jgi:hypothetical protein
MTNHPQAKTPSFTFLNPTSLIRELDALSSACGHWEQTAYKTANEGLYAILSHVYQAYEVGFLGRDGKAQVALRKALVEKMAVFNMRIVKGTSVLAMMLRYVFKSDRKRISRYVKAIIAANSHGVRSSQLADWLRESGGIDEVSKAITVDTVAAQKGAAVEAEMTLLLEWMEHRKSEPLATVALPGCASKDYTVLVSVADVQGNHCIVSVIDSLQVQQLSSLIRHQAEKNLADRVTTAALNREAEAFIKRSASDVVSEQKAA